MNESLAELKEQNELADSLIQKMERIRSLWEDLPSDDDMKELTERTRALVYNMEKAIKVFNTDNFPTLEKISNLNDEAFGLAANLEEAKQAGPTGGQSKE